MKTNKYRILKVFAVLCFILAIIEFGLAILVFTTSESDEYLKTFYENVEIDNYSEELSEDTVIFAMKIIFGIIYCIEATFFIIEGYLIYRAIKKGKTTFLLIFILIGILVQLISLISVAIHNSYGFNSAVDLFSIIIKTIILKQVFEIRRLNSI